MNKADKLRVRDYLGHMLEAIQRITGYTEDMTEAVFLTDSKTQDAVIRNLEIIGEAARNVERLHSGYAAQHSEVPWSDIYLMRNRVAHGYFSVDLELVWKTIQNDLPLLEEQVRTLLKEFEEGV